jgi:hypothetical protein
MLRAQGVDGVAAALRAMFTTALRRDEKPEPQPKPEQQSEAKREPNLQNCTAEELRSQIEKIGGKVSAKSAARFKEIATKLFEAVREHDIHIHASGVAFLKSASRDDLTWTPKQQKFLCDLEERIGAELDWGADA